LNLNESQKLMHEQKFEKDKEDFLNTKNYDEDDQDEVYLTDYGPSKRAVSKALTKEDFNLNFLRITGYNIRESENLSSSQIINNF
jgi:hypothetical protein